MGQPRAAPRPRCLLTDATAHQGKPVRPSYCRCPYSFPRPYSLMSFPLTRAHRLTTSSRCSKKRNGPQTVTVVGQSSRPGRGPRQAAYHLHMRTVHPAASTAGTKEGKRGERRGTESPPWRPTTHLLCVQLHQYRAQTPMKQGQWRPLKQGMRQGERRPPQMRKPQRSGWVAAPRRH